MIPAFMAHHHGMSLLALEQSVLGPLMQARFLSNPDFRAATLLLQERIPKATALMTPHTREAQVSRRVPGHRYGTGYEGVHYPNTPVPKCICSPTGVIM